MDSTNKQKNSSVLKATCPDCGEEGAHFCTKGQTGHSWVQFRSNEETLKRVEEELAKND